MLWLRVLWSVVGPLTALCCGRAESVLTSMQKVDSRTQLTCQLNHSSVEITGHRWVRGSMVLLEDSQPGLKTEY